MQKLPPSPTTITPPLNYSILDGMYTRQTRKKLHQLLKKNSQEDTCSTVSFFSATLLKKSLWYRCFPVNFAKFLRTPFLENTSGRFRNGNIITLKYCIQNRTSNSWSNSDQIYCLQVRYSC